MVKTIAESGNIANSSEKLYLTQSALSHQLRELEERLGFKVFHRARGQWQLTEAGSALNHMANQVLSTIADGLDTIEKIKEGAQGHIKVGTECYAFYQGLPGFIQKMGLLYPGISVSLVLEATHQPIAKVLTGDIDIALTTQPAHDALLEHIAVFEDELFALVHDEHPLASEAFLTAQHFANTPLFIHSFPLDTVAVYQHFLQPNGVVPTQITAIPLTEVALEMVGANMGIMCTPKWALKAFKLPEGVIFKRLGHKGIRRKHYLVYRHACLEKAYVRDFIANFKDEFCPKGRG